MGSRLLEAALQAGRDGGFGGLLVKANPDASGFFSSCGLVLLRTDDPERDYPYRYWYSLAGSGSFRDPDRP